MEKINEFEFKTSQSAWSGLNKFIAQNELFLAKKQGINKFGTQMIMNDTFVHIRKSWVDPEFDFGRMFGYKIQKWTSLVRNYVDMNYLDLIAADIKTRESKKSKNYSLSYHFANSHTNGKDCLISIVFSRRPGSDWPVLNFHTRATELTKRFLIDLLLVHRIGEYVYGDGSHFSINFFAPYSYITAETFSMFDTYKPIDKLMATVDPLGPFQERILKTLSRYKTVDPLEIKYKSNRRAVLQLQTHADGEALSRTKPLLAGNLKLVLVPLYPEHVVTSRQRKAYRQQQNGL